MFRNCFELRSICWVVLMVLTECGQRATSGQTHGVLKPNDLDYQRPIYDRLLRLSTENSRKESMYPAAYSDPVGGEREKFVDRNTPKRSSDHGQDSRLGATTEADPTTKPSTETLAYAARLFRSTREKSPRNASARKSRQMVEYYVDSPNGVIDTRPSREGQYHVTLGEKSFEQTVAEERDVRGAFDREETGAKLDEYRPRVVNDDSGEAENIFFSEAKQGQNREALDLFRARSKRSAENDTKFPGRSSHHRDVISSIINAKDPQGALRVEYKAPGLEQRNADPKDLPYARKNLTDFRNRSGENANTAELQTVVKSILENDTVARFIRKASTRSERRRRQILEYFVDSLVGRIDKRDANAPQASTEDRSGKRHASLKASDRRQIELSGNADENDDKRKNEKLERRNAAEETGRSVENDSDDLEDVLQKRDENAANSKILRHNYAISDADDADDVRNLDKRRAVYEDPEPSDADVQEEDFYYVEDQSNLVKRDSGRKSEKLDYEFDDNMEKSKRAVRISEEERKVLSKELVDIMLKEISDRLQGKPGHPELQVRRPASVAKQQEKEKTENREMHKRFVSVTDEKKLSKSRNKRLASHSDPTDEEKRRSTRLEEFFDESEAMKRRESKANNEEEDVLFGKRSADTEERLEHRKRSTADEDAEEDLDMTKQIVAIVIEHAVKHLRNLAHSGTSTLQLQKSVAQQESAQKSLSEDTEQMPPLLVQARNQTSQETTPAAYWVVEPIPKGMAKTLVNTSDEYFAEGLRYHRVTFPPYDVRAKSANYESEARRRRRRRRRSFIENGKSVQDVGTDFSSSAIKTRVGQRVLDGVESAIFCRVIRRLVDLGKISRESFETLLTTSICFNVSAPYRNRIRRSSFRLPIPASCQTTGGDANCSGSLVPVSDPLTGGIADPRCGGLTYVRLYPSVYNFYRGQVTSRIPLGVIHNYGGYVWGGIGTGIQPPTEPPKWNNVWGVLFSFRLPFRLWGMRFIESPPTLDCVRSVVVYLHHFDDTRNRWTPVTEAGSKEPQLIPVTSPLIRFTEIRVVTGILIFPQEWRGKPILPHPVFISCTESDQGSDPFQPPIFQLSSWKMIMEAIARDSKTYAVFDAMIPNSI